MWLLHLSWKQASGFVTLSMQENVSPDKRRASPITQAGLWLPALPILAIRQTNPGSRSRRASPHATISALHFSLYSPVGKNAWFIRGGSSTGLNEYSGDENEWKAYGFIQETRYSFDVHFKLFCCQARNLTVSHPNNHADVRLTSDWRLADVRWSVRNFFSIKWDILNEDSILFFNFFNWIKNEKNSNRLLWELYSGVAIRSCHHSTCQIQSFPPSAWGARIAQLVKAWICNLRIAGSSPTAGGVFFWYGPLEGLSLQIAIVGSDHHTKKMEVPTRGLR